MSTAGRAPSPPGVPELYVLSSVRWGFLWQRHHALARAAAALGYRVTFQEPHPRGARHVIHALRARARRSATGARATVQNPVPHGVTVRSGLARLPGRRRGTAQRVVVMHLPSRRTWRTARRLRPDVLVYDSVLDWSSVPDFFWPPRGWRRTEDEIARRAARGELVVTTDSPTTAAAWEARGVRPLVLPPVADDEFVAHPWTTPPVDGPVGYFGSIRYEDVDVEFLAALAAHVPVSLIGTVDERSAAVLRRASLVVQPPVAPSQLPPVVDGWSAVVLPYRARGREATVVPAKIGNALATGRPVYVRGLELPPALRARVTMVSDPGDVRRGVGGPPTTPERSWQDVVREMVAGGARGS